MPKQKIYYLSMAAILVVIAVVSWGIKNSPKIEAPSSKGATGIVADSDMAYYCSQTDQFCVGMEKYFEENKIKERISFTSRDILKDPESLKQRDIEGAGCGLKKGDIGIPFLFAQGKCYVGEKEIKSFFEKKLQNQ